jgi:HAD superfamily hydrolase (TIGR01509 family)
MAESTGPTDVLIGVLPLLDELSSRGVKIGLGSSSKNARMILQKLDLIDRFSTIVDGNNITLSKPDPEVFFKAANAMGFDPNECLVIEDAQSGVDAALTGGFHVIGVGSGLENAHMRYESLEGVNIDRIMEGLNSKN